MPSTTEISSASVSLLSEARAKKDQRRRRALLGLSEVLRRTRMGKSAWYAAMAAGTAPKNVRLPFSRSVAWVEEDIDAWIDTVLNVNGHLPFGNTGAGAGQ